VLLRAIPGLAATSAVIAAAILLCACGARGTREIADNRPYPMELRQQGSIDIQVIQHTTTLELTNSTTRQLAAGTLWLNGRFARDMEPLAPGERRELDLDSFVDEFGDRFRPGGFWATDIPDRVVLAQWEERVPGEAPRLVGLVAVSRIEE
jgi:hypothetical protein